MDTKTLGWGVGALVALVFVIPLFASITGGEDRRLPHRTVEPQSAEVQSAEMAPAMAPAETAESGEPDETDSETPEGTEAAVADSSAEGEGTETSATAESTEQAVPEVQSSIQDNIVEHIRQATQIDGERISKADEEPGNWLAHGRTYSEQRYSPLNNINELNVGELGYAWEYDTDTIRGLEASPIVVDGVMFATGSWSKVYAIDAKTGEEIWAYDPEVPGQWARNACCDVVNRGVAVWKGRVYVGTIDGRLVSLDAATGSVIWDINTIDRSKPYTITGAPRIVNDMVIIGNGGAELGVRGYITAYDTETGEKKWRFYTVPGNPDLPAESKALEKAMPTWSTGGTDLKWWEVGGGGTVWDSMAYDPELDLLYIGVGNGSPWSRWVRSPGGGDNLYLSSIVALKPETGEYVWHYQTTPGDTWDYTATQHMILADMTIDGRERKVIMQAPKNGFFYVLDRETGEFISAEKYVQVTWATGIDPETGRPIEDESLLFENEMAVVYPPPSGGHNWHPMAFNPTTGLVYIPALQFPQIYTPPKPNGESLVSTWNTGLDFGEVVEETLKIPEEDLPPIEGFLKAWDPVKQKEVWSIQHPTTWNGGLLTTAGNLIFQGTGDGRLVAYRADSGDILKEINIKGGAIAPPVTYTVDGEQYVVIAVGFGGAFPLAVAKEDDAAVHKYGNIGRILSFKLGGAAEVPGEEIDPVTRIDQPPAPETDEAILAEGQAVYHRNCAVCHGFLVIGGGTIPDLRYSTNATYDRLHEIVLDGELSDIGMPRFDDLLKPEDVDKIRAYIINEANEVYKEQIGN